MFIKCDSKTVMRRTRLDIINLKSNSLCSILMTDDYYIYRHGHHTCPQFVYLSHFEITKYY